LGRGERMQSEKKGQGEGTEGMGQKIRENFTLEGVPGGKNK